MTHEYTVLTGGIVLALRGQAVAATPPTAIAWAEDTVLAVGDDAAVRAVSRGDSRFHNLNGAVVVPLGEPLEPGAPADLAVLDGYPGEGGRSPRVIATVRAGRVVEGALPNPVEGLSG